jgi:hypothetical protein
MYKARFVDLWIVNLTNIFESLTLY